MESKIERPCKRPKLEEQDLDQAFPLVAHLPTKKLPLKKDVIGLILFRKKNKSTKASTEESIVSEVAEEVRLLWIRHNIYPNRRKNVRVKTEQLFNEFKCLRKQINQRKIKEETLQSRIATLCSKRNEKIFARKKICILTKGTF